MDSNTKTTIRQQYDAIPESNGSCCGDGSATFSEGYSEVKGYEEDADYGLGCGLPTQHVTIQAGHTVLDLGSGAGNDAFIARRLVGEDGRVLGVDFAPKMVAKARENAEKLGYANVAFVEGDIEQLPVAGDSVDVVLSNCVLNLVSDKQQVFSEMFRVLKPGGQFSISDIVTEGNLPQSVRRAAESYAGCAADAMDVHSYLRVIRKAGFADVDVVKSRSVMPPVEQLHESEAADLTRPAEGDILSITVRGSKPDFV